MGATTLLEVLVWVGTITFAVAGGLQAVERRFDLVGVLVLSAVTAVGGGSVRDVIGGRIPPPALTNERSNDRRSDAGDLMGLDPRVEVRVVA